VNPHETRYVFLGDYVDRGPDSKRVVDIIKKIPGEVVTLRGNHEQLLLDAIANQDGMVNWLLNGGGTTLKSFGVDTPASIPATYLKFFEDMIFMYEDEHRYYVHAGFMPGTPVTEQTPFNMMWIRDKFLYSGFDFGKLVVHGHTPEYSGIPDLRKNRLNLDTAVVSGGNLTAAVFTDKERTPIDYIVAPQIVTADRNGGISVKGS